MKYLSKYYKKYFSHTVCRDWPVHLKHQMWYCLSRATKAWPSFSSCRHPAHSSSPKGGGAGREGFTSSSLTSPSLSVWIHFWHRQFFPVNVTLSPVGNGFSHLKYNNYLIINNFSIIIININKLTYDTWSTSDGRCSLGRRRPLPPHTGYTWHTWEGTTLISD